MEPGPDWQHTLDGFHREFGRRHGLTANTVTQGAWGLLRLREIHAITEDERRRWRERIPNDRGSSPSRMASP